MKVALVVSPDPGAGKTTFAVNLAHAAAECGERALVLDANPDHPIFDEQVLPRFPSDLMRVGDTVRLICALGPADLDPFVMPILAEEREIVAYLSGEGIDPLAGIGDIFDFVIIDGPSLMSNADVAELAAVADDIVLIQRSGGAHPSLAALLARLGPAGVKLTGTVVSMADPAEAA